MRRHPWWAAVAVWLLVACAGEARAQVAHDLVMGQAGAGLPDEPLALPDSEGLLQVEGLLVAPPWANDRVRRAPDLTVELRLGIRGRDLNGDVVVSNAVPIARTTLPYAAAAAEPDPIRPRPNVVFRVRLADGDLRAFASANQGRTWMFELVADPDGEVFEGRGREALLNSTSIGEVGGGFRPVSGQGRAGNLSLIYTDPAGITPAEGACAADVVLEPAAAGASWAPASGGAWQGRLDGTLCLDWALSGNGVDYDLQVAPGRTAAAAVEAEVGGVRVQLVSAVRETGLVVVLVGVGAERASTHAQGSFNGLVRPEPYGAPGVLLAPTPAVVADFDALRLRPSAPIWVNPGELPFSLRLAALQIDPDQVSFPWDRAWSHLQRARDPSDPRGQPGRFFSNDARFIRVGGGPGLRRLVRGVPGRRRAADRRGADRPAAGPDADEGWRGTDPANPRAFPAARRRTAVEALLTLELPADGRLALHDALWVALEARTPAGEPLALGEVRGGRLTVRAPAGGPGGPPAGARRALRGQGAAAR